MVVYGLCLSDSHQLDLDKLRLWLEEILWDKKHYMDVYCCKGVPRVVNSDELHTIQAVREIYEIVPARKRRNGENQTNKSVFVGRSLNLRIFLWTLLELVRQPANCCNQYMPTTVL